MAALPVVHGARHAERRGRPGPSPGRQDREGLPDDAAVRALAERLVRVSAGRKTLNCRLRIADLRFANCFRLAAPDDPFYATLGVESGRGETLDLLCGHG